MSIKISADNITDFEVKWWSGKPSDSEFLNYTKNSYLEVFGPKVKTEYLTDKNHKKNIEKKLREK